MKSEYINHLHVEGVGPFNRLDIDFSPDVNVIIGVNGSGKTSILRCLTHCFTTHNREYFRYKAGGLLWAYFKKDELQCRSGGAPYDLKTDQAYHQTLSGLYRKLPEEEGVKTFSGAAHAHKMLAIGAHRYFDYQKIKGMKEEQNTPSQCDAYAQMNPLYLEKPLLPDAKQWMINRYFIIEKAWGKDLKANWDSIIEYIPLLSPPNHHLEFKRIEQELEPIFSYDGKECFLEELSSGFKSILSIFFCIINWIEGVNDGEDRLMKQAKGTVLIDELESHLHPAWQRTILKLVTGAFPNLQFIITTHSPYIVASADKGQVIVLPPLSDNINIKPTDQVYSGWRYEYIVQDLMGGEEIVMPGLRKLLEALDNAFDNNDQAAFDAAFGELKSVLNPRDSIILNYNMKRAERFGDSL